MTSERFRVIVIVLWIVTIALLYNNGRYGRYGIGVGDDVFPWIIDTRTGICYMNKNNDRYPNQEGYIYSLEHGLVNTRTNKQSEETP